MEVLVILALIALFTLFYLLYRSTTFPSSFPPAPWPKLPILGHVHLLAGNIMERHTEFRKKHGDIVSIQIGAYSNIILHTIELVREAFSNPLITGRPDLLILNEAAGGKIGLLCSEGRHWTEQKNFALRYLRKVGFGKTSSDVLIQKEISELFESLKNQIGKPLIPASFLKVVPLNVMWKLVTGEKFYHSDPQLKALLENISKGFETSDANISIFFPRLVKLFPKLMGYSGFQKAVLSPMPFYIEKIAYYKKTYKEGVIRNFIDAYIQEMGTSTDPNSSFHEKTLLLVIHDLFIGGFETTSLTLTWMILYLIKNPEIQEKMYQEIIKSVGKKTLPGLADKLNLPYSEAVMLETLRCSSIIPVGIMKTALEDIEFHGYKIPKGTGFCPFIYGIHHDPKVWGDPENFRPERFINEDGNFKTHNSILAFSYGQRPCLGEAMARNNLFLMSTALVQKFKMTTNPNEPSPKTEPILAQLNSPYPFTVILNERSV